MSPGNMDFESISASSPTHQNMLERSGDGFALISSKPGDFEKTLQDLDREIHGIGKGNDDILGSNDPFPAPSQAHLTHTANSPGPNWKTTPD